MPRPKLLSDSELLDRAFEVISREGFESFTFEQVARVSGLSPAALVKRFKNKNGLALAARNRKWDENLRQMQEGELDRLHGLEGIFQFLRLIAQSVDSDRLGEHARWLGAEADDPRSRVKVAAYFAETRRIFQRLVEEAVFKGELLGEIHSESLAKTLEALVQGAIFQFAFLDERSIQKHLEGHFQTVLGSLRENSL